MEISDLLDADGIVSDLSAASKKQALQVLARHAADGTGLPEQQIFDVLLERERLGSTGVGRGVAIPHGKIPGLGRLYGLVARLADPVPFEAVDDHPVDLVFLLLAPESAGAEHLKALARISRLLRDRSLCERLRQAENADQMRGHLLKTAASYAA